MEDHRLIEDYFYSYLNYVRKDNKVGINIHDGEGDTIGTLLVDKDHIKEEAICWLKGYSAGKMQGKREGKFELRIELQELLGIK